MSKLHFDVAFDVDEEAVPQSLRPAFVSAVRTAAVLDLLRREVVTESLAAQMLGLSRNGLYDLMAEVHFPPDHLTVAEVEAQAHRFHSVHAAKRAAPKRHASAARR